MVGSTNCGSSVTMISVDWAGLLAAASGMAGESATSLPRAGGRARVHVGPDVYQQGGLVLLSARTWNCLGTREPNTPVPSPCTLGTRIVPDGLKPPPRSQFT